MGMVSRARGMMLMKQMGRAPEFNPDDIGERVGEFQGYAREGVEAYGRQLQRPMLQRIGTTLGGLNSIGALRSGGTEVALNDISRDYAEDVGNFASRTTLDAIGQGAGAAFGTYDRHRSAFESDRDFRAQEEERRRRSRAGFLGGVGRALGTAGGFLLAGPGGAAVGSKVGGKF